MKKLKLFSLVILSITAFSCGDDDGILDGESAPLRSLTEVAAENDTEIREFLETHFYNYEDFIEPVDPTFDFKIKIDTISGDNSGKTPLINQVEEKKVKVSAFEFLVEGEEDIEHSYYFLSARQGTGGLPTIADSTFVRYQGSFLDGEVFDENSTGTWWDNPSFQFPNLGTMKAFRGVGEGVTNIASGSTIIDNPDGTFGVEGYGVGMIIIPSGLGTFNGVRRTIGAYSPLIFKIDVLWKILDTDHDNDGIPSIEEDLEPDGVLVNDNTDGDLSPNYLDTDDDDDGISTRDEISDDDGNIIIPYPDCDNDGIPDYLDTDSCS